MWSAQYLLFGGASPRSSKTFLWGCGAGRRAAMTPTKKKRGPVAEDGAAWPSKRRNALEDSARGMHGERAKVMRADEALAEEAEAALAQAESVRADVEPRSVPMIAHKLHAATWHALAWSLCWVHCSGIGSCGSYLVMFSGFAPCCNFQQHVVVSLHWLEASCAVLVLSLYCTCACQSAVKAEQWACTCRVSPSRVASDADPVPDSDEDLPNGAGLVNKASPPQEASSDSDSDGDEVHVEQVEPLRQCQQQRVQAQEKRSQALACQAQPSQAQPSQAANSTQRAHGKAPLLALRAHPKVIHSHCCSMFSQYTTPLMCFRSKAAFIELLLCPQIAPQM